MPESPAPQPREGVLARVSRASAQHRDLQRAFRVPAAPVVGVLGAGACLYLFWQSFQANWHWMSGWIAIGLAIYFGYSRTHSKLNK